MGNIEDKESDSRHTVKTAMLNTIANGISLVVGMMMIPIIVRVISQEELGVASTFLANRNIIVIVATLAVYSFVHKAMIDYADEKKSYIFTISLFCVAVISGLFVVCMPLKNFLQKLLSLDEFLYYWLFVSVLAFALYNIAFYYCLFHNKSTIVFFIVMSTGPLSQFVSVGLAKVMSDKKYIGRVLGLDLTYVIVSLVLIVWLLFSGKKRFEKKYLVNTLKFSVPVIPHLLSQMVLTQCDLIMISYFCGNDKSGIYSMGHTVGFLALTVMSQLMASWSPWVYRRLSENDPETIKANTGLMVTLGAMMSIGLMSICPELIKIFLPAEYLPCIYILPPLVMAMFFQFIYLFFYDLEYYNGKPQWIATASVIAALLNLVLNYIFIKAYGYVAACYTTLASYFVLLLINYLFARKLNAKTTYNLPIMICSIIVVIVYMILMFIFVDSIVIRYAMLLVIGISFLLVQKKKLISFAQGIFAK